MNEAVPGIGAAEGAILSTAWRLGRPLSPRFSDLAYEGIQTALRRGPLDTGARAGNELMRELAGRPGYAASSDAPFFCSPR